VHKPDKETMKRRATGGAARSSRNKPALVSPVALIEHRQCGTSFPRTEACPSCGKRLLEG
jgi:hypothetical protein